MNDRYDPYKCFQTSSFDFPESDNWDGYSMFNSENGGGIFAIFRNNSPEKSRIFRLNFVDRDKTYMIHNDKGDVIEEQIKGKYLSEEGIEIKISSENDYILWEIFEK